MANKTGMAIPKFLGRWRWRVKIPAVRTPARPGEAARLTREGEGARFLSGGLFAAFFAGERLALLLAEAPARGVVLGSHVVRQLGGVPHEKWPRKQLITQRRTCPAAGCSRCR
mmetsp:Transcript_28591/g.58440  ORF Transcript_28591/g.58440 Transcript_28591/m.58440 type:complete len:113 (+) Transcript_28591:192-530(+)